MAFDWSPDGERVAWIAGSEQERIEGANADGTGRWGWASPWQWTDDLRWTAAGNSNMVAAASTW